MALSRNEREQAIEWLRDIFAADLTKVILSTLILLSVLPVPWVEDYGMVFFGIFAVELSLRGLVLYYDLRQRRLTRLELLVLLCDLLATLSFLPIDALWSDIRLLRLFRLSRMLLLLGYWGPVVREVGIILSKRERRYQLSFVLVSAVLLSFTSALLLEHFRVQGVDFNDDGVAANESFWSILWWSFRQIESPDNLLADPQLSLAFVFSILLTLSGLFLFSFLVGMGASVVEELVALSKERRIGMRRHTVICNISPFSERLLLELVKYYAKSLRSPRIVTLGSAARRYDYMHDGPLLKIRYRQGQPLSRHDLIKVDTDRARRVILLRHADRELSDSEIVSQVLSVREVNRDAAIYVELLHADNIDAARQAGGRRLVPVLANRLASMYLANIIVFPGVEEIYGELLTSQGDEIYTCLYSEGTMSGKTPPTAALMPFGELLERAHLAHGIVLLGYLLDDPREPTGFIHALNPGVAGTSEHSGYPAVPPVARLRGFFGVAANFESMRGFVESLPDVSAPPPAPSAAPVPRFGVCPGTSTIQKLLICGFHEGLIDCCEELFRFAQVPEIYLLVPEACSRRQIVRAFVERPEEPELPNGHGARLRFSALGDSQVQLTIPEQPDTVGLLHVIKGDWTDEQVLSGSAELGFDLAQLDAVLLTYTPSEADPDANTALALLKLLHLKERAPQSLKPGFRIICEVKSTEKAALFQRRFALPSRSNGCRAVSIVAAEELRNSFLAQAIFVPGIVTIYRELLSQAGMYLCKLLVAEPVATARELSFGQLLATLYQRDGLLVVAVELEAEDGGRRIVLNPRPRDADYIFAAGQLHAIFAVGEFSHVAPCAPCAGCHCRAATGDQGSVAPDGDQQQSTLPPPER